MTSPHDTEIAGRRPAEPCPFCGFLIEAGSGRCGHCMLPLDDRTLGALEPLMGPWFVFEPKTPSAPGVSWKKFCDLVEKGKVRPDSVVRGPSTGGLWKLARETPSVATRLGLCWACRSPLPPVRTLSECPGCGALLNGAMDWAPPQPAAADAPQPKGEPEPQREAGAAIEDLIQAGAAAPANAPAAQRPLRWGLFAGLVGLLAAASLGAGFGWAFLFFTREQRRPPPPDEPPPPVEARGTDPTTQPPRLPRTGPLPGELWPDIREYTGPTRTRPKPPAEPTGLTPQPRAARSRAADLPPPDELARQKATAGPLFAAAKAVYAGGDLMSAQKLLLKVVNAHHRAAWPAGTAELLREVQSKIRASTRPADQLSPADLDRQKASGKAPSSAPSFFDIEARP